MLCPWKLSSLNWCCESALWNLFFYILLKAVQQCKYQYEHGFKNCQWVCVRSDRDTCKHLRSFKTCQGVCVRSNRDKHLFFSNTEYQSWITFHFLLTVQNICYLVHILTEVYNFDLWPVCLRLMWRNWRRRRTDSGHRLMTSSWRAERCCSLRCLWGWRLPLTGALSFSVWFLCPWQLLFIHSCLGQRGFKHVNCALETENIQTKDSQFLSIIPPFHQPAHCITLFCPSTIDELFNFATQAFLPCAIERLSKR